MLERNEILAIYGKNYAEMTVSLLEGADLAGIIGNKKTKIFLKPNLVVAADAASGGVTHPEIVDGVLTYLEQNGFMDVKVLEGSWVGDRTGRAYQTSGIAAVCKKHGIVPGDLQRDTYSLRKAGSYNMEISDLALEREFLINLPVFKGHCQTMVTCSLKNHKGLLSNKEKRHFHSEGLHRPIAALGRLVSEQWREFIVVDNICGDLDFEEGGTPVEMNRIFCALDPVLCDAFTAAGMGYQPEEIAYIPMAAKLGVGSMDLSTLKYSELNDCSLGQTAAKPRGRAVSLAKYAAPKDACSACYGALIYALNRLDEMGEAGDLKAKVCIGQGYQNTDGELIGVGKCTRGCKYHLGGCPPKAADILDFLEDLAENGH